MAIRQSLGISDFAEFADSLQGHRARTEATVRSALNRVDGQFPDATRSAIADVSRALEHTLLNLDTAAEELRAQNEALFAARIDLEASSAQFRDLFELAPSAYFVTTS